MLAVLDVSAMAQTVGAVAMGLRDFGPTRLAGIVANGVASPRHAAMVAAALREIPMLASLPRHSSPFPERHLGLVLPAELKGLDRTLDALAESLTLDASAWNSIPSVAWSVPTDLEDATGSPTLAGKVVAIARDEAFAFIYPANVE